METLKRGDSIPELPEVETISRSLQINLGARITKIDIKCAGVIRRRDFEPEEICGSTISSINRKGKFLNFIFENGLELIIHMGMSGRFYMVHEDEEILAPHVHVIIHLDNKKGLVYQDARRFGGLWLIRDSRGFFSRLGREPLSDEFTAEYLAKKVKKRRQAIKTLLLNQSIVCGIGNIYADEALFEAAIRPDRPAGSLSASEIGCLCKAIKEVMQNSIQKRGTTFRDFRDGYNKSGGFQDYLKVYGKTDQDCSRCGGIIKRKKIGGRSTHFCDKCQK